MNTTKVEKKNSEDAGRSSAEHMIRTRSKIGHGLLLLLLSILYSVLCPLSQAQDYTINWHTMEGGGGTSTGDAYAVSGTIGQPDVGTMSGGNYVLTGGFWVLYALQTPGAPTLHIIRSGTAVTVYWHNVSGWTLQQNGNLATSSWSTNSSWTSNPNGTNYLQLPSPTGNLFFRLTK